MHARNHRWNLYDAAWFNPIAGGDLTGSRPSQAIEGTMTGAAVAMAEDMSFLADGVVELTLRLPNADGHFVFDASIGDWQGYQLTERGEIGLPTSVLLGNINMKNVSIAEDGSFRSVVDHRTVYDPAPGIRLEHHSLNGWFYGPDGQEAAGTFTISPQLWIRNNQVVPAEIGTVHGAFGARKPDEPQ